MCEINNFKWLLVLIIVLSRSVYPCISLMAHLGQLLFVCLFPTLPPKMILMKARHSNLHWSFSLKPMFYGVNFYLHNGISLQKLTRRSWKPLYNKSVLSYISTTHPKIVQKKCFFIVRQNGYWVARIPDVSNACLKQ